MAELTRHRTVTSGARLDVGRESTHVALFQLDEDAGRQTTIAYMERGDWVDMGSPAEVTITFEPGNVLQAEEDADAL